jgi:hypothetical protein
MYVHERRRRAARSAQQRLIIEKLDTLIEINKAILDCLKVKSPTRIERFWDIVVKISALATIAGGYAVFEFIYRIIRGR